jgi:hypothetical protein
VLTLGLTGRIWICVDPQDGRKSFDGLAGVVASHLSRDPLSVDLYVYRAKLQRMIAMRSAGRRPASSGRTGTDGGTDELQNGRDPC